MSLLKPSVTNFVPFDATKDFIISINIDSSSDQCFGNRIIIYNNSTNAVVYDNTVTSFLLQHSIPQNTLTNGITYKIIVSYFNESGIYSSFSDGTIFKCLAVPIVSISNILNNEIIASNTFTPMGSWSQTNEDTLNTYEFYLYDENDVLLQSSPVLFYSSGNTIKYQFSNFINNTKYGFSLHTMSTSGVEVNTDIVHFTVEYIAPTFSGTLNLTNLDSQGAILVKSNVVQIIGQIGSGNINYQDDNWVDLRNGMIYFDITHGMSAFSNFTLGIFVKNVIIDEPFLVLVTSLGKIELCWKSWNQCINATKTLTANLSNSYNIFGQKVSLTTGDTVFVWLQQNNNYLNLQYEIKS